jgi:type II secretory pathway component PulM
MKKLNPRETLILILTLGLTVFFIAYQFVIKPMHEGSVDINDRLRVDNARLSKARQMVDQKSIVENRYQHLMDLIGANGSDEAQMTVIVSKIESAAREKNIHLSNIQPQKTVIQKEARFLMVELEIDGQWLDILQFIYVLQQQPNFYFINEVNLEKYSGTTNALRGRIVISRMCLINP